MMHSSQIQLTRDGLPLVVTEPDALEPRPCRPRRLPPVATLVTLDREIQSITRWALRAILNPGDRHRGAVAPR